MSEEEVDYILLHVSRVQVDDYCVAVPKGWWPSYQDLQMLAPALEKMRPEHLTTWRNMNNSISGEGWDPVEKGSGTPYHIDARPLIAKLPPAYDPEELKEFIEEGTKAWADVPDAAAWVRELRGGKP
jgi:hypothetical protein